MRALLLFAVLATPAFAQSTPDAPAPEVVADTAAADTAAVDGALVGEWTLDEVVAPGPMGDYGVEIQTLTCRFSADGQAQVSMAAVQDGDTMSRVRKFAFTTEDGQMVEDNGDRVAYRLLDDGALQMTDGQMVIRLVRADG